MWGDASKKHLPAQISAYLLYLMNIFDEMIIGISQMSWYIAMNSDEIESTESERIRSARIATPMKTERTLRAMLVFLVCRTFPQYEIT